MTNIVLIGVQFNFANGVHNDFTSVNLNFNSAGGTFTVHGFVECTIEEYQANMANPDKLANLIKGKVLAGLTQQVQAQEKK